jgi:hypothetical protein
MILDRLAEIAFPTARTRDGEPVLPVGSDDFSLNRVIGRRLRWGRPP